MTKINFSIEGDIHAISDDLPITLLMNRLGNKYFVRNKETSSIYHLANVFVSNLTLSLLEIGTSYLKELGLSEKEALNAVNPLIKGNIENIYQNGFADSLTGPVVRGDIETIKNHLSALNKRDIKIYENLSLNLLRIANSKENADENLKEKYAEIFRLLGGNYSEEHSINI